jgi:hypothetical protein
VSDAGMLAVERRDAALPLPIIAMMLFGTASACGGETIAPAIDSTAIMDSGADSESPAEVLDDAYDDTGEVTEHCDDPTLEPVPWTIPADIAPGPFFTGAVKPFVLPTWQGEVAYADLRKGCSSIVFLVHFPGYNDALFDTDPAPLVTDARADNHFVIVSDAEDPSEREAALMRFGTRLDGALRARIADPVARAERQRRFHFATVRARAMDGGPGEHLRAWLAWAATPEAQVDLGDRGMAPPPPPQVFGIRPDHRFDPGDALLTAVGAGDSVGMAAWLGHHYAWRQRLEVARREGQRVELHDATTTARRLRLDGIVPDSDSVYWDRVFVDIDITCNENNPFACSEWDRLAHVYLCTSEDCVERDEIARWVTPYWRRGEQAYRFDVSMFSRDFRPGENVRLEIELGPEWERATPWHVAVGVVVVRDETAAEPPRGRIRLLGGGTFDASWNDRTVGVTTPVEASRFAVLATISGHGQQEGTGCAEWCDHRHRLRIDDIEVAMLAHEGAAVGSAFGCARLAADGVLPGQWGNWPQTRAWWCPGLVVTPRFVRLDGPLKAGSTHVVSLESTLGSDTPPPGGDIAMSSWLLWW